MKKKLLFIFILFFVIFNGSITYAEGCDAILTTDAADLISEVVNYIRIGVPILLIVLSIIDFAGVVGSDDENAMKVATSRVAKRFIAAALVFFVPLIISLILGIDAVNNALNLVNDPMCGVETNEE